VDFSQVLDGRTDHTVAPSILSATVIVAFVECGAPYRPLPEAANLTISRAE
jgi:hypothetical protein